MANRKIRRNHKKKQIRNKNKSRGINVKFTLANSPRKQKGLKNMHVYKTNIHNLIYVKSFFQNVKYTASNITNCNFRNSKIIGVDYINTNLKNSEFKNSLFENVVFYSANLKGTNFLNARFQNVYFINTNTSVAKNLDINQSGINIFKGEPLIKFDEDLVLSIKKLMEIDKISKNYVLTTKNSNGKKINKWIVYLLMQYFSKRELIKFFQKMYKYNTNKKMFTYYSYFYSLSKCYKKNDIL